MNVATINMDPEIARAKLKAFRAATHRDAEEVYRQAAAAYEVLAKGTPLLRLSHAIQNGGFDTRMRPRLAIARADRDEVHFEWGRGSNATFDCDFKRRLGARTVKTRLTIDLGREHGLMTTYGQHRYQATIDAYAIVPMIPADVRPKHGQLRDWHVLWEVGEWFDRPRGMKAPVDPLLLQHVEGDLYAVLAQWDLTPLEQAILEGAMRS